MLLRRAILWIPKLVLTCAVLGSAGSTVDGARLSLIEAKEPGACDLWGVFCPSHSRLIVFDAATNRVVFRMKLPNKSGRPALSPNGKHLAVLEHDRLEVFGLPEK